MDTHVSPLPRDISDRADRARGGNGDRVPGPASDGHPDAFASQLLTAMLSLRNGDFSVRLPADVTGLNGKIADTFNDIASVSERRSTRNGARVSRRG